MDKKAGEAQWQKRLLPLMIGMLLGLTLFFFVASLVQLYYLHGRIEQSPRLDLSRILAEDVGGAEALRGVQFRALLILEGNAIERRYHQANVLLMSRVWTRYLGFVTGMILTLVGAAFILGKLREPESKLDMESSWWKVSLTSASPGLVLALFGTILMLTTIVSHTAIEVNDGPLYFAGITPSPSVKTKPVPLPGTNQSEDIDTMLLDTAKEMETRAPDTTHTDGGEHENKERKASEN